MQECGICFEKVGYLFFIHDTPSGTQGHHRACLSCIDSIKRQARDGIVLCPFCRKNTVSSVYQEKQEEQEKEFVILVNVGNFGRQDGYWVKGSDTILEVKKKVERAGNVPVKFVKYVVWNGKRLEDHQTLDELNIGKNTTLIFGI